MEIVLRFFEIRIHILLSINARRCYMDKTKTPLTVTCTYDENGKSVETILRECLRTFIQINLQKMAQNLT